MTFSTLWYCKQFAKCMNVLSRMLIPNHCAKIHPWGQARLAVPWAFSMWFSSEISPYATNSHFSHWTDRLYYCKYFCSTFCIYIYINIQYLLGASEVSANLYCNSRSSVLGRLRDHLPLLMKRSVISILVFKDWLNNQMICFKIIGIKQRNLNLPWSLIIKPLLLKNRVVPDFRQKKYPVQP